MGIRRESGLTHNALIPKLESARSKIGGIGRAIYAFVRWFTFKKTGIINKQLDRV